MACTRFLDPIGPGSRAWECFDNALVAYQFTLPGERTGRHYHFHRYTNQRRLMVRALRAEGAPESLVQEWLESLRQQCKIGEL